MISLVCASCTGISDLAFAPVAVSGSVGDSFRTRQFADEDRSYTNQVETSIDADTFIWHPWFMTLETEADLAYEIQTGGTAADSGSFLGSGQAELGILPLSRYPSSVRYRHVDSRVDGSFTGSDSISDEVAVSNRAIISSDLNTSLGANFETVDQPDLGDTERVSARFGVNKTFTTDRLGLNLSYLDSDFAATGDRPDIEDETETLVLATLTYDAMPLDKVTTQSATTFIYEADDTRRENLERYSLQGISTAQWRPSDKPFTFNAALRTLTEDIELQGPSGGGASTDTKTDLASGTIGFNYPVSPQLATNAGLNARIERIETEAGGLVGELPSQSRTAMAASALGNITYTSLPEPVLGFDWRWNASGGVNLTIETDAGFSDSESSALGHSVSRTLDLEFLTPLRFTANQEVSMQTSTTDGVTPSLFHGVSFSHSSLMQGVATFARLSVSDRRELTDDRDEFQLVQLQLNRQEAIDLTSNWLASLSVQFSRQKITEDANTTFSANGTLSYRKRDVFDVRNLLFTSDLVLNALGLEDVLTEEDDARSPLDEFRSDWRNRFEYRIGRVIASLEGTLFYNREELGNIIFLRVRREFGGVTR